MDQDPEQPARGALLQLRAVPPGRGSGDAVLVLAQMGEAHADSAPAAAAAGRLPAPGHGQDLEHARRRDRLPHPAADRPVPHADRERSGAVAGETLAARIGGDDPHPEADLRFPRPDQLREAAFLQPLALYCRAPATRQSKPRAQAHVLGTRDLPARHEPHPAL